MSVVAGAKGSAHTGIYAWEWAESVVVGASDTCEILLPRWTNNRVPRDVRFAGAEGEDVKDDPVAICAGVWSGANVADQVERPMRA